MRLSHGLIAVGLLITCGCNPSFFMGGAGIPGSGILKEETRQVGEFHAVDVGSALRAIVAIGPKAGLVLSGDDNLLPLVKTEVRDGKLVAWVDSPTGIQPNQPLTLTITTPNLDEIDASGAARLSVKAGEAKTFRVKANGAAVAELGGVATEAIDIDASGASQVTIEGKAKAVTINASGTSQIKTRGVFAESVKLDASGASQVETSASGSASGTASGASSIVVQGQPQARKISTSGAAHVNYVEPQS